MLQNIPYHRNRNLNSYIFFRMSSRPALAPGGPFRYNKERIPFLWDSNLFKSEVSDMEKITALYCRFAYSDNPEVIEQQKQHLTDFARENGFSNLKFYIDSGVSGLTMDRPAFCEMMNDMEQGEICTVIAEDASRICRRSSVSSEYIEEIFPSLGAAFLPAGREEEQSLMDVLLSSRESQNQQET